LAQYKTGTVSVTNGSNAVTGQATVWSTNAAVGYTFKIKDEDAIYNIASIVSDTQITLTVNYAGTTKSNQEYQITRDFTPNLSLPEIWAGDIDWPFHLTDTIRKIDTNFAQNVSQNASPTFAGLTLTTKATKVRVFPSATQLIPLKTWTKVRFDSESFDALGEYDNITNYRFTASKAGYYCVMGTIYVRLYSTGNLAELKLTKNGVTDLNIVHNGTVEGTYAEVSLSLSDIISLSANDYLEWFVWQNGSADRSIYGSPRTWMTITWVP